MDEVVITIGQCLTLELKLGSDLSTTQSLMIRGHG
uniref:Uncharacterized protein n=1 Tax=Brassica oleracea TaxID=3712 RepID=A0A3P6G0S1_BRAOL|nr:unnamed protein product [Brassica oleracea]